MPRIRGLRLTGAVVLLAGALGACSSGASTPARTTPTPAATPASGSSGSTTPAPPGTTSTTGGQNPAELAIPSPDSAEIARLAISPAGGTSVTGGRPPVPGQSYVIRGRCISSDVPGRLAYSIVDAQDPSKLFSGGEITCNAAHETMNTALPASVTSRPVTILVKESSDTVTAAYAVVVPSP
jgi:hypothetical protein